MGIQHLLTFLYPCCLSSHDARASHISPLEYIALIPMSTAMPTINSHHTTSHHLAVCQGTGAAIVAGYNTGMVRIFTEGGRMLIAQARVPL